MIMKKEARQLLLIPEFQKFITASATGRRLMPSGKKIRASTIQQYQFMFDLLEEFETRQPEQLRILILHRSSLRVIQKEKNYWSRFFKNFSSFLYKYKGYYDLYASSVFKGIKTFFHYLAIEKVLPIGEFHKKFRVPAEHYRPVILTPSQLRFLITDKAFEQSLPKSLQRTKDIFVFGCIVALRYSDLMRLKKSNIQYTEEGVNAVLHTQKTGAEVKIPLPGYAVDIIHKYQRKAGRYVLPRLANSNFNLRIKSLIKKAEWNYSLPKIRHKQGVPIEVKTKSGGTYKFYDHITAHTMRRTAITTLLLMGVDETSVRMISGHAPGSREFYRYVVLVQDYLDAKVREAHQKLLQGEENLKQKVSLTRFENASKRIF
jgi:integrase